MNIQDRAEKNMLVKELVRRKRLIANYEAVIDILIEKLKAKERKPDENHPRVHVHRTQTH